MKLLDEGLALVFGDERAVPALVHEGVDVLAELEDLVLLGLVEMAPTRAAEPVDGDARDELPRPLALDVIRGPDVEAAVVADGAVLPSAGRAIAPAQVGRLEMDSAEIEVRQGRVEDLLHVTPGFLRRAAHHVVERLPGLVLAPDRRIGPDDLIVAPTEEPHAEQVGDAALLGFPDQPPHLGRAGIVGERAGDVGRIAIGGEQAPGVQVVEPRPALHVHRGDDARDGDLVEVWCRPLLERQRLAPHVVDPAAEGDPVLVTMVSRLPRRRFQGRATVLGRRAKHQGSADPGRDLEEPAAAGFVLRCVSQAC